jgi:anti-sigma regulatory factor (Ser/Thr protein kinase)
VNQATFEPNGSSVRAVRSFIASATDLPQDLEATVALLASELAANSVLHARTSYEVGINAGFGRVRVSVTDSCPRLPVVKLHSVEAATGRGLRLVQELADRWGVESHELGKTVWFEFDVVDPGVARSA